MFAIYGTVCHICGHGGAREADHLVPLAVDPDQPVDPHAMRPAHGSNHPCRQCTGANGKPRKCNQERGTRPLNTVFRPKIDW